ncbi:MAG: hypothetical protein RI894_1367, partial [Bacteroidota bacterium]
MVMLGCKRYIYGLFQELVNG